MGDRRSKRSFGDFDDRHSYGHARSSEGAHSAASRYDRSRYSDSRVRGDRSESSRRSATGSHGVHGTRRPYHDSFFEDMRLDDDALPFKAAAPTPEPPKTPATPAPSEPGAGRTSGFPNDSERSAQSYSRYNASSAYGRRTLDSDDDRQGAHGTFKVKKRRRKLPIVLGVILALVLVGAGSAYAYVNFIAGNLHSGVDEDLRNALVQTDMANEPFYMLLLGTDGSAVRDNDAEFGGFYRSDSLMLARIDPVENKVTLISIGRDIVVDIPGHGEQKINAAYGLGGPALVVKTVSQLAGVNISHFAQVDFDGFSSLVDALGGVEVDVPVTIDDYEAGGYVEAGLQTLNGEEALILCRSRNTYLGSSHPDEMRAANQRLVMGAIAKKLLASNVASIATSVTAMSQFVTTDIELMDLIGLAQAMQGLDPSADIYTAMAPTHSEYQDDTWFEILDKNAWNTMMERVKKGLPPVEEGYIDETTGTVLATAGASAKVSGGARYASITVKNGTQRQGLATKAREELMAAGFVDVVIGDVVEGPRYPETLVIYDDEVSKYGAEQIVEVLGQGEIFFNDGSYLLSETDYLLLIGDNWTNIA